MAHGDSEIVGEVPLADGTRLKFAVRSAKGEDLACVSKCVGTTPARPGLEIPGEVLCQVVGALRALTNQRPAAWNEPSPIPLSSGRELRFRLVGPGADSLTPSLVVQDCAVQQAATGIGKRSICFEWARFPDVLAALEAQLALLVIRAASQAELFPEFLPPWIRAAKKLLHPATLAPAKHLLTTLPAFPEAFLPPGASLGHPIRLPGSPLQLHHERDGSWQVVAITGFRLRVRNEVEGRFLLYAQRRGAMSVALPTAMLHVFQTVAGYEKHCRELREKLIHQLEARCHNRHLAEFQTRQLFQEHGLPLVDF